MAQQQQQQQRRQHCNWSRFWWMHLCFRCVRRPLSTKDTSKRTHTTQIHNGFIHFVKFCTHYESDFKFLFIVVMSWYWCYSLTVFEFVCACLSIVIVATILFLYNIFCECILCVVYARFCLIFFKVFSWLFCYCFRFWSVDCVSRV